MPTVKCLICKGQFYTKPNWLVRGWGKYCSRECSAKGKLKGKFVSCGSCGKKIWKAPRFFKLSKSGKLFCNKTCQTLWRNKFYSDPNHPLWTGGEDTYREILINANVPLLCSMCGYNNQRVLAAHHRNGNRKDNQLKNFEWL